jgi:hypothetical protein
LRGGELSEELLVRWSMMSVASAMGSVVKGGCAPASHRGAQSLGCLADGKREGDVLLNVSKVLHRVPTRSWERELGEPHVGRAGYGASRADSRFPVIAILLRSPGCRELLFNHRHWFHGARPFRWLNSCKVNRWPL